MRFAEEAEGAESSNRGECSGAEGRGGGLHEIAREATSRHASRPPRSSAPLRTLRLPDWASSTASDSVGLHRAVRRAPSIGTMMTALIRARPMTGLYFASGISVTRT